MQVALWLLVGCSSPAHCFLRQPRVCAARRNRPSLRETLSFRADFDLVSEKLPGAGKEEVVSFLKREETRNILLGFTRPVQEQPMTPQYRAMWEDVSEYYGPSSVPNDDDRLLSSCMEIHFPGMTLLVTVLSGVKVFETNEGMPEYAFYLVGEIQSPRGPLAWLFNILTGRKDKPKDEFSKSLACAATRVSIVDNDGGFAISFDTKLEVEVQFPSALIKLLPVSKEKMEEQGSASVRKALSKDMLTAVTAMHDAFLEWRTACPARPHSVAT
jgi:hypothetical protein